MFSGWACSGALRPRLEAGDVLRAGQRQQLPGLCGVEDVRRGDVYLLVAVPMAYGHAEHAVAIGGRRHRAVGLQHDEPPTAPVGGQHGLDDRERDPRFVAQPAHPARPRVEVDPRPGAFGQRIVAAVVVPDPVAEGPVAGGRPELLDPGVLVGRHSLARELATEPVELLGQDDAPTGPGGGEGGRHPAEAPADDEYLRTQLLHVVPSGVDAPPLSRGRGLRVRRGCSPRPGRKTAESGGRAPRAEPRSGWRGPPPPDGPSPHEECGSW